MEQTKIKIIIADDNKKICDMINDYLINEKDMDIIGIANNGVDALKLIQEKKPDLVILDMIMPQLDGLEVLTRLKTLDLDPMPHIVVLSAVSNDKISQRAISLGAGYYVLKPFDMEVLVKRIRLVVNKTMYSDDVKSFSYIHNTESKTEEIQSVHMIAQITNIIQKIGIPAHIKG